MAWFAKFGYLEPEIKSKDIGQVNDDFIRWIRNIRSTGKTIMSGSLGGRAGGLTIMEADSLEEATRIFELDPFNKLLTSWDVHEWVLLETGKE